MPAKNANELVQKQGARVALFAAAALNLVPLAFTGLLLRSGTVAGGSDVLRMQWIATHQALWVTGWSLWMGGSLGLLLSIWTLTRAFASRTAAPEWLRFAVPLAIVAATADIIGDSLQVGALPAIAQHFAQQSGATAIDAELFHLVDQLITVLSGCVGNTGYFVAGALVTAALARSLAFPAWITALGIVAWVVTLAATPAAFFAPIIPVVVAAALFLYAAWLVAVAIWGLGSDGLPAWLNRTFHRV